MVVLSNEVLIVLTSRALANLVIKYKFKENNMTLQLLS